MTTQQLWHQTLYSVVEVARGLLEGLTMFVAGTLTRRGWLQGVRVDRGGARPAKNDAHLGHDEQQCQIYRTISRSGDCSRKIGKAGIRNPYHRCSHPEASRQHL